MTTGFRGQSVRRLEDERFLVGRGRFIEDIDAPGQAWMQVVRSPHAHARITAVATAAAAMPGVLGVFTAADLADLGPLPCTVRVASVQPMASPPHPALAVGRVRHVGDPVTFVVATSRDAARNAAEAVIVDYETLPVITDPAAALREGAPQLWDEAPGNLSYRFQKGDSAAVQAALAAAAHVVELELVNNRIVIAALETRGGIASYDDAQGYHLQFSGAGVHGLQAELAGTVFHEPAGRMRVSCPDVGGGFGVKSALYPEWVMLLWAARRVGRPIKWIGERVEDFITTAQGRANLTRARLALDAEGNFLALDVDTIAELGAYLSSGGPGSSTTAPANAMGSGYVIPAIFMDVRGVFTNTVPIDAYRGAGKPEVNYMIERLIDEAARACGFDRIALRRRNLVRQFPYHKALGTVIDCGRFAENLDAAILAADHAGFPARRDASRQRGQLRGIGITCFMETARGAPNEGAEIRFEADGTVTLVVGTQSNGMGHETSYRQIAADLLGLPLAAFRYVQADTLLVRDGNGHGGARSMHMGGSALVKAVQTMLAKGRSVAAGLLQAPQEQVEFADGRFVVRGDPARGIDLLSVAAAARDPSSPAGDASGLDTYVWNLLDLITFPNGCHIAEVEIDRDTGEVILSRYTAVDDFGTLLNPMLTLGQVQGGVVQGIGQALLEHTVYDPDSGQLLSGSLMDYTLPRASDIPPLDITFSGVPTAANPLGLKGAGQAGAIASPQAVVCAVLDALAPLGVSHVDMPVTAERVWRAMQGHKPAAV